MIVPPTSVGVFVIASGICLILLNSLRRGKTEANKKDREVPVDDKRCGCCLKPFIIDRGAQCHDCTSRFCRKACGHWEAKDNVWLCLFCHHKRTWVQRKAQGFDTFQITHSIRGSKRRFSTAKYQFNVKDVEYAATPGVDKATGVNEEMASVEIIREIIERVVEDLIGNVDDAPIDRLYQHPSYKPAADTPSMAHTALRELVERAVDEARKLPGLGDSVARRQQDNASVSEQSYEDLLAAAILNKVVEKYQKGQVDSNSNVVNETTVWRCRQGGSETVTNGHEPVDSQSQDECDSDCRNKEPQLRVHQEPLSLTIEEQIEEVTTTYTSDEEPRNVKANALHFRNAKRVPFPEYGMDIVDPSQESSDSEDEVDACISVDHITPLETWEENWLFQRKKIAAQPEPVAMLVPNPSEDYRALIGDKDADDISDLSEFSGQSDEEVDEDFTEAINQLVPESPKLVQLPTRIRAESAVLHDNFTSEIVCEDADEPGSCSGAKIESEIIEKGLEHSGEKANRTEIESSNGTCGENSRENLNDNADVNLDGRSNAITPTAPPISDSICEGNTAPITSQYQMSNEKLSAIDDITDGVVDHQLGDLKFQPEIEKLGEFVTAVLRNGAVKEEGINQTPDSCDKIACQAAAAAKAVSASSIETSNGEDHELSAPPRPGTIAEREHRKWENAAPIENNPYSQENIQKRLLERQYAKRSPDVSGSGVLPTSSSPPLKIVLGGTRHDVQRFARDYYINEVKSPSDGRGRPSTSNSSRPSSSLSENSASTSSDYEHQESFDALAPTSQNNREEPQAMEEMLERARKNSKNEINAKLNNQGSFDTSPFDAKKPFTEDNNRKIRRIDLRAYGFSNQFNEPITPHKKPPRVVNKLDLSVYGYDSGLRRTQSNNQLDSKVNNSFISPKVRDDRFVKSNLTQNQPRQHYIWTQSTEDLNKRKEIVFDKLGMTSAKSVPNIAKISSYCNGNSDFENRREKFERWGSSNGEYDSDSQNSRAESAEEFPGKLCRSKEMKYSLESLEGPERFVDAELHMPSVKRLREAFCEQVTPIPKPRANRPVGRTRSPDIQLVKTPRQMHSLTARSLSKEFREALRQIKPNAQPVHSTVKEQSRAPAGGERGGQKADSVGRLRNNIQFWEELQRKV